MTRLFRIHDVGDEPPVQYVGVYVLAWRGEWGEPTAMFAEVDDPVYDAAPEMLEICKSGHDRFTSASHSLRMIAATFDENSRFSNWLYSKANQMDAALAKAEGER